MRLRDENQLGAFPSFVRELNPAAFAFVMATGIVSTALLSHGATVASTVLLVVDITGYLVLLVSTGFRIALWPRRMLADFVSPKGFAYLTFVAGTNVLATRLALGSTPRPPPYC